MLKMLRWESEYVPRFVTQQQAYAATKEGYLGMIDHIIR